MVAELNLTAGALAIKRVSGAAGVQDLISIFLDISVQGGKVHEVIPM